MTNRRHKFYIDPADTTAHGIIQSLGTAEGHCYEFPEFELLGTVLSAIKMAIFLRKKKALDAFLLAIDPELRKLKERL